MFQFAPGRHRRRCLQILIDAGYASMTPSLYQIHQRLMGSAGLILRLDSAYKTYDLRLISDVPDTDINFVTLPSGVCVHLNAEGELELFFRTMGSGDLKQLKDAALQGARLFARGTQLLCSRAGVLYRMTLKSND